MRDARCVAASIGRSLGSARWYHPDLLEEPQGVPHLPGLGDLAAGHAMDADGVDTHLVASGGDAVDLPDVGAGAGPADDDLVSRGEQVVDLPVAIRALLV